jgi:uncharacterized membrane protein YidH (DUF202 family)
LLSNKLLILILIDHIMARRFSILVKNVDSTARDHLANERTFLAWSKTGLGFVGAGTGLLSAYSFGYSEHNKTTVHPMLIAPAVALLIANGGAIVVFSTYRYMAVQNALRAGNFIINKSGLFSMVGGTGASTLAAVCIVAYQEFMANKDCTGEEGDDIN